MKKSAKPSFRPKSLWNSLFKDEIFRGDVGYESVLGEAGKYSGTFVVNDGKSNYCSPPGTIEDGQIDEYLDDLDSYPVVEGYGEVFSDGQSYDVFVSLIPGRKREGELELLESDGLRIEWRTQDKPDF